MQNFSIRFYEKFQDDNENVLLIIVFYIFKKCSIQISLYPKN